MAERFEFEVVAADGSIVGNDSAASSSSSGGSTTPSAREQRQEENQQLRREAAERARQRESDRREDRADKKKRQELRDITTRENNLLRFRNEAHRRRLAQERAIVAEQNRGFVRRRRFINNLFGGANQAHFGRRINHVIDFVNSLGSLSRRRREFEPEQAPNFGFNRSSLLRKVLTEKNLSVEKQIRVNQAVERGKFSERLRNTRNRISERKFNSTLITRFSRISQRTGNLQAARIVGGSFLQKLGPVGSALSRIGPLGLAAGAGFLAVTGGALAAAGAFVTLNRMTGRLIKSIEGIPSPVLFAQIETQFEVLNARFQRAERLGEGLAQIERVQGQNTVKTFGLVDNIASPLLPVTEALNRLYGVGLDFLNMIVEIDSKMGVLALLEGIGNGINLLLDLIDKVDGKTGNVGENIALLTSPLLFVLNKAVAFFDDQKETKDLGSGAIMRDLFRAMNNPIGDINAPFEVNVGPDKIKNVFEGL